jgi:DNA-binding GntR family transcriptional regulator
MNENRNDKSTFSIEFKEPQTLRERIYLHLREAITNGMILPGERIIEKKIAEELKVSITPVREALLQLNVEGFVEIKTHRNVVVKQISLADINELYEIQGVLEGYAARRASLNLNDQDLSKIKKLTEKMEKYFRSNNVEKFYESNKEIHEIFLKKSNNQSIYDLISNLNLRKKMFRYRVTFLAKKDVMKKALDDHKKILNAFLARDSDTIERLIREHWISDSRIREFENGFKKV